MRRARIGVSRTISRWRRTDAQIVTSSVYLFKPGETFAIRQGSMNGTPLPHEEPQEVNPPSGAVVYYSLKAPAKPLKLELVDGSGAARSCAASVRRCVKSIPRP